MTHLLEKRSIGIFCPFKKEEYKTIVIDIKYNSLFIYLLITKNINCQKIHIKKEIGC